MPVFFLAGQVLLFQLTVLPGNTISDCPREHAEMKLRAGKLLRDMPKILENETCSGYKIRMQTNQNGKKKHSNNFAEWISHEPAFLKHCGLGQKVIFVWCVGFAVVLYFCAVDNIVSYKTADIEKYIEEVGEALMDKDEVEFSFLMGFLLRGMMFIFASFVSAVLAATMVRNPDGISVIAVFATFIAYVLSFITYILCLLCL